jgi:hypothetical protein
MLAYRCLNPEIARGHCLHSKSTAGHPGLLSGVPPHRVAKRFAKLRPAALREMRSGRATLRWRPGDWHLLSRLCEWSDDVQA